MFNDSFSDLKYVEVNEANKKQVIGSKYLDV